MTFAYMAVSVESLLVQVWALRQLWRHSAPGLVRTAACRVGCSVLYVAVGVNAALTHGWAVLEVTFAAYVMTQVTWQLNSRLDMRLARSRRPRR